MPARASLLVLLAALALAGCGRLGELEPPPGGSAAATPVPTDIQGATTAPDDNPGTGLSLLDPGSGPTATAVVPPAPPPKKRFFLDFLL